MTREQAEKRALELFKPASNDFSIASKAQFKSFRAAYMRCYDDMTVKPELKYMNTPRNGSAHPTAAIAATRQQSR